MASTSFHWAPNNHFTTVSRAAGCTCILHVLPRAGLVDERDRPGAQVTYVAQENILPSTAPAPILHRGVEAAFEAWQPGLGYVPCHEVQELYPEDAFVGSALAHSNAAGGTVDAGPLEAHLPPVRPTYAQAKADADAAAAARE